MEAAGPQWRSAVFHGLPWTSVEVTGLQRGHLGLPLRSVEHIGSPGPPLLRWHHTRRQPCAPRNSSDKPGGSGWQYGQGAASTTSCSTPPLPAERPEPPSAPTGLAVVSPGSCRATRARASGSIGQEGRWCVHASVDVCTACATDGACDPRCDVYHWPWCSPRTPSGGPATARAMPGGGGEGARIQLHLPPPTESPSLCSRPAIRHPLRNPRLGLRALASGATQPHDHPQPPHPCQ